MEVFRQIWAYREMLKSTVRKDLRTRYKGSALGFLWTMLNPLLQLAIYSIVFKFIMRIQVPGYDYTIFLFVGLVPWTSFATSILMSNMVFFANTNLIKRVYFPRILLPLSTVLSNLINMFLAFLVVFPVIWIAGAKVSALYAMLPLIVLIQGMIMFGIGLMVSSLYVYFRDLEHLLSIFVMTWMYLSPVIYTPDFVKGPLYHFFKLNPMFTVINAYRDILLYDRCPNLVGLGYSVVLGVALVLAGYMVYENLQRRFAEAL